VGHTCFSNLPALPESHQFNGGFEVLPYLRQVGVANASDAEECRTRDPWSQDLESAGNVLSFHFKT
jgi:hypothetical protein